MKSSELDFESLNYILNIANKKDLFSLKLLSDGSDILVSPNPIDFFDPVLLMLIKNIITSKSFDNIEIYNVLNKGTEISTTISVEQFNTWGISFDMIFEGLAYDLITEIIHKFIEYIIKASIRHTSTVSDGRWPNEKYLQVYGELLVLGNKSEVIVSASILTALQSLESNGKYCTQLINESCGGLIAYSVSGIKNTIYFNPSLKENIIIPMPEISKIGLSSFKIEKINREDDYCPLIKISTEANFYNKVVSRITQIEGLS